MDPDDEANIKEKYTEDFLVPGADELKSLESWSHQHGLVLQAGRLTHLLPLDTPED